jgi:DNA-binding IscR family transcriptional regulator
VNLSFSGIPSPARRGINDIPPNLSKGVDIYQIVAYHATDMSANANFTTAIHILTFLAGQTEPTASSFIAASLNTNPVTVRRMILRLREARLVETVAGSTGGAMLGQDASRITLADVYAVVKEDLPFGLHPQPPSEMCPVGRNIQHILAPVFQNVDGLIAIALAKLTIQDIWDQVGLCEKQR